VHVVAVQGAGERSEGERVAPRGGVVELDDAALSEPARRGEHIARQRRAQRAAVKREALPEQRRRETVAPQAVAQRAEHCRRLGVTIARDLHVDLRCKPPRRAQRAAERVLKAEREPGKQPVDRRLRCRH